MAENKNGQPSTNLDPQECFEQFFKMDKYRQRLATIALSNSTSLTVNFNDLIVHNMELAEALLNEPDEYLKHASNAAFSQLQIEDSEYAERLSATPYKITIRVKGLPSTVPLRGLGSVHIGKLVMVEGIVVRSTPVRPLVTRAAFKCRRCGEITYIDQSGRFLRQPLRCNSPACGRGGYFDFVEGGSTFVDSQELRIQERPEELPPGQLPRHLNVRLVGRDLMDQARPGDQVVVVGVLRATAPTLPREGKLRAFQLHLDANHVEATSKEPEAVPVTPEEEREIRELSKDPWIHRKIVQSIAPSIYGYDGIKEAIMCLLFGGVPKQLPDMKIRGEANILLVGDPAVAKSQMLKHTSEISPRGLYTSGRGTTAAGLCVSGDTVILTDKGPLPIREVVEGQLAKGETSLRDGVYIATNPTEIRVVAPSNSPLQQNMEFESCSATQFYRIKADRVVRIETQLGEELKATPETPVVCADKKHMLFWKEVRDVKPGDYLAFTRQISGFENKSNSHLVLVKVKATCEEGCGEVYDLTVHNSHAFIANGFIVHNTAAVIKEKGGGMSLEAGALVLADRGIAAIDELDKIRPEDRVAIHEALEQHTVCYDDKTEVLTEDGWKLFRDLSEEDSIATLSADGFLKYQRPTALIKMPYRGKMVKVTGSRKVDLVVTPNHKMYVSPYRSGSSWHPFRLVEAKKIVGTRVKFKRDAKWRGEERSHFVLPPINGKPEKLIPMDIWLEFFGYWLANGCADRYRVHITKETNVKKIDKISTCLEKMPFKYSYNGKNFTIHNKQLGTYLQQFGHASEKHIPKELKRLSSRQLKLLLDAMMLCDGHSRSNQKTYCTTSKKLADDVQEILLKIGLSANIHNTHSKGRKSIIHGHVATANFDELVVGFIFKNSPQVGYKPKKGRNTAFLEWVDYEGIVYCVEVPNHIIYVRRNGIPVWSGNSIAKGGIVATLNARCGVLAAANPTFGRYNAYKPLMDNINFPPTLLSRFDLIFLMRDVPEAESDRKMSKHILSLHRTKTAPVPPPIEPDLLKKYIAYARSTVHPALTEEAEQRIQDFYLSMRSKSADEESPMAITPRQLESLIRLAEARAKAALREKVLAEDAEAAVTLMQASLQQVGIDVETGKVDVDILLTGKPKSLRDKAQALVSTLTELQSQTGGMVERDVLLAEIQEKYGVDRDECVRIIAQLTREGVIFSPRDGYLKKT